MQTREAFHGTFFLSCMHQWTTGAEFQVFHAPSQPQVSKLSDAFGTYRSWQISVDRRDQPAYEKALSGARRHFADKNALQASRLKTMRMSLLETKPRLSPQHPAFRVPYNFRPKKNISDGLTPCDSSKTAVRSTYNMIYSRLAPVMSGANEIGRSSRA
jgi:hypothetical protein